MAAYGTDIRRVINHRSPDLFPTGIACPEQAGTNTAPTRPRVLA